MATATLQKRLAPKQQSSSLALFGVELLGNGDVRSANRTYRHGKGFYVEADGGTLAWKIPFVNAVYFQLSSGRILAFHYSGSQRRWREASLHLVPTDLNAAVPSFSLRRLWRDLRVDDRCIANWQPSPSEYVLSKSLQFLPGARIRYEDTSGNVLTTEVSKLPIDRLPVNIEGVDGPHYLRKVGAKRFNLETPKIQHKERFLVSDDGRPYYRHCYAEQLATSDCDAWGIRYLEDAEILLAEIPIPFRLQAEGNPWVMDLPYGRVSFSHESHLVLRTPDRKYAERFYSEEKGWHVITSGMWEVKTTWVLAEKALSVTVCDVLELFSNGSCCFLKQYTFQDGMPIDVSGPNNLRLVREDSDIWLSLFEGDELLGMGYFERSVFHEKDGTSHPSWAWGVEVDLPGGNRNLTLQHLLGGVVAVASVMLFLAPKPAAIIIFWLVAWALGIVVLATLRDMLLQCYMSYGLPAFRIIGNALTRGISAALKLVTWF